jgi:hypothetical protein
MALLGCGDVSTDRVDIDTGSWTPPPEAVERPGLEPLLEAPSLVAFPTELVARSRCVDEAHPIELHNVGGIDLRLQAIQAVGDLRIDGPETAVLGPGEFVEVAVVGPGTGLLVVASDDPEQPRVDVPIDLGLARPLSLEIIGPDRRVEAGQEALVEAYVTGSAFEGREVSWFSHLDGFIGSALVDEDGFAALEWSPIGEGFHALTATLKDDCGLLIEADGGLCRERPGVDDGSDAWHIEGTAYASPDGTVELTPDLPWTNGSAFLVHSPVPSDRLDVSFEFYVTSAGVLGADGLSLTLLDSARQEIFLGPSGGGMGFGEGVEPGDGLPGLSIEIDTSFNTEVDPTRDDHLAIVRDGDLLDVPAYALLPELEDGAWHDASVSFLGDRITVLIDGVEIIDTFVDLDPFTAYVGFTAATGSLTARHAVRAVEVSSSSCH